MEEKLTEEQIKTLETMRMSQINMPVWDYIRQTWNKEDWYWMSLGALEVSRVGYPMNEGEIQRMAQKLYKEANPNG